MGSQRPWFPVLALIVGKEAQKDHSGQFQMRLRNSSAMPPVHSGELAASAQAHPHRSLVSSKEASRGQGSHPLPEGRRSARPQAHLRDFALVRVAQTQALNSTANTTNSTSRGLGGKYKYLSFEQILRYGPLCACFHYCPCLSGL